MHGLLVRFKPLHMHVPQVPRSIRAQLYQEALDRLASYTVDRAPMVRQAAAAALGMLLHFDSLCDLHPAMLHRTCVLAEASRYGGEQWRSAGAN